MNGLMNKETRQQVERAVKAVEAKKGEDLAILEMETNARLEDDSRRYFAKPGEAEWGC